MGAEHQMSAGARAGELQVGVVGLGRGTCDDAPCGGRAAGRGGGRRSPAGARGLVVIVVLVGAVVVSKRRSATKADAAKATTVLAMLHWLGVKPSYSRPRVSDDNAFVESLFKTAKYRPEFPAREMRGHARDAGSGLSFAYPSLTGFDPYA